MKYEELYVTVNGVPGSSRREYPLVGVPCDTGWHVRGKMPLPLSAVGQSREDWSPDPVEVVITSNWLYATHKRFDTGAVGWSLLSKTEVWVTDDRSMPCTVSCTMTVAEDKTVVEVDMSITLD
jgi:hypothetical protein